MDAYDYSTQKQILTSQTIDITEQLENSDFIPFVSLISTPLTVYSDLKYLSALDIQTHATLNASLVVVLSNVVSSYFITNGYTV